MNQLVPKEHKRPQMTSKDVKRPQRFSQESSLIIETVRLQKNKLKGGSLNENLENDDTLSDEIIKTNNSDRLSGTNNANCL